MWILLITIISINNYGDVVNQSTIPGFNSSKECLDFGNRWKNITHNKTDKISSANVNLSYDCMKK